jgi:single-strand DNA-binding protein
MATLNKVMLIGRLTKDPEAPRTLPNSGSQVVRFRFAVGRSRKNEQGGWDKDPNQLYIDCEAYHRPDSKRNLVDLISRYAKQGDPLFIEGRLVFEEWTDKQTNQQRSKHKIVVDSVEFLGSRQDDGSGGGRPANTGRPAAGRSGPPDDGGDEYVSRDSGEGDNIPF